MKINTVYSTLAMAMVLAATGCKHKPVGVTPMGERSAQVQDMAGGSTLQPTPPITSSDAGGGPGIAPTAYDPNNFTQDSATLEANSIHFPFDSATIRDSDQQNLQAVAAALQQNSRDQLLVQGNCDERGTEEYNRSLGERRALAAREALAGMGVSADRVHEISFGKDKPADPGHDEAAWSKNRRDDFVLLIPKAGM
jgi:peptidoglycan-associated lipoprotein